MEHNKLHFFVKVTALNWQVIKTKNTVRLKVPLPLLDS